MKQVLCLLLSTLASTGTVFVVSMGIVVTHMHVEQYAFIYGFGVHFSYAFQLVLIHV